MQERVLMKTHHSSSLGLKLRCALSPGNALLAVLLIIVPEHSTSHAAGGPGYAVHVGAGNYVQTPSTAALNSYPITVTAWFRTPSTTTSKVAMIAKINSNTGTDG